MLPLPDWPVVVIGRPRASNRKLVAALETLGDVVGQLNDSPVGVVPTS